MITTYQLVNGGEAIVRRHPSESIFESVRRSKNALDLVEGPELAVRVYDQDAAEPRRPTPGEVQELEVALATVLGTKIEVHPYEPTREDAD